MATVHDRFAGAGVNAWVLSSSASKQITTSLDPLYRRRAAPTTSYPSPSQVGQTSAPEDPLSHQIGKLSTRGLTRPSPFRISVTSARRQLSRGLNLKQLDGRRHRWSAHIWGVAIAKTRSARATCCSGTRPSLRTHCQAKHHRDKSSNLCPINSYPRFLDLPCKNNRSVVTHCCNNTTKSTTTTRYRQMLPEHPQPEQSVSRHLLR